MIDKIIELARSQAAFKRVCVFLVAFAVTVAIMGGNHEIFYGSSFTETPKEAQSAQPNAAEQEASISAAPLTAGLEGGKFAGSIMYASAKEPKLEEVSEKDVKKKKSESSDEESEAEVKKNSEKDSSEDLSEDSEESSKPAKKKKKKADASEDSEESGFVFSKKIPMSRELQEYTYQKCVEHELEYELVLAIMWRESGFKVNAVHVNTNGTRDNGIMQINDVNRGWLRDTYGITDLMDPHQNIDAGTAMLGRLTKKYGSHNAMLAYQYGEGGMAKKLKQGITTSHAIEKAYKQREIYRKIFA